MTKRIVMAVALVVGTTSAVEAQTISATATVASFISEVATQDLTFGNVAATAPSVTVDHSTPASLGYKDYSYNNSGYQIDVTVTTQPTNGSESLSLTVDCEATATTGSPAGLGSCAAIALPHDGGVDTQRVWVGGTLTGMSTVSAGLYSGVITFQVTP